MARNLFKRVSLSFLLISFLAACGNVRFTATPSTDALGAVTDSGNPQDPGGAVTGNDGGPRQDGDDGTVPGPTPTPPSGPRSVESTLQVSTANKQVDFLLVIDNSASMIAIQQKMAASMSALATQMNNLSIDWQMCLTVTTDMNQGGTPSGSGSHTCAGPYCTGNYSGGTWYWGVSIPWHNGKYVLNKSDLNADANIFNKTIPSLGSGDSGTGDERGIKAAYNHFENWKNNGAHNTKDCYRSGSSVAVILLSDEDERSVAGDCSRVNTALGDKEIPACRNYSDGSVRTLEYEDLPSNLVSQASKVFGTTSRFTFNSIIADTDACQDQLNKNVSFVKDGISYYSPHYTGTVYKQASTLTSGGVASLCSSDLKLNLFSDVVVNSLSKVNLECTPTSITVRTGSTKAGAESANPLASSKYYLSGAVINFNPALLENTWVNLQYTCAQ